MHGDGGDVRPEGEVASVQWKLHVTVVGGLDVTPVSQKGAPNPQKYMYTCLWHCPAMCNGCTICLLGVSQATGCLSQLELVMHVRGSLRVLENYIVLQ